MKKIMLLLATEKGYAVLEHLLKHHRNVIGMVVSFNESGVMKDWYYDIKSLCDKEAIQFENWNHVKNSIKETVICNKITGMIAISWRFLIPLDVNDVLNDDLIVFHDSLLPQYRGFAPVVTAMICGERRIGATAFFATDEVDKGDIICQKSIEIEDNEYIENVIHKMSGLYVQIVEFVVERILADNIPRVPQDEKHATYSIWRDEDDYRIDWNRNAEEITRFVRALSYPYKGAYTDYCGERIRITRCETVAADYVFKIRDPGKIWEIMENRAVVICGSGMVCVSEAYKENGERCVFKKIRSRFT